MDALGHPDLDRVSIEDILHAMGDPARLAIVRALADGGERPCGGFDLCMPKATASRHFRLLREAGLIRQRPQGTQHLTSLRRDEVDARFPGLLAAILATDRED